METPEQQGHCGGDEHPAGADLSALIPTAVGSQGSESAGPDLPAVPVSGTFPGVWSLPAIEAAEPSRLAALLGQVAIDQLDFGQGVAVLTGTARARNWLDALEARLLVRIKDQALSQIRTGATGPTQAHLNLAESVAIMEAATTLKLSEGQTHKLLDTSCALVETFPATLELMETGALSRSCAAVLVDQGQGLDTAGREVFETRLLERAPELTRDQLNGRAHRLRCKLDPESLSVRHRRALAGRRIFLAPAPDGMAWLHLLAAAPDVTRINARLNATARNTAKKEKTAR